MGKDAEIQLIRTALHQRLRLRVLIKEARSVPGERDVWREEERLL
jgi:hypothetical protein